MEKGYWLGRKAASLRAAESAVSAEARSAHYELAARYHAIATSTEAQATYLVGVLPPSIRSRASRQNGSSS